MMKNRFLFLLAFIFIIGIATATESGGTLIGKQDSCIQLPQECTSCSYVVLTSIQYPNLSRSYVNSTMTKQGSSYNYSFCDTANLGNYIYCTTGDVDGTDTSACKPFEITCNGKEKPAGIVIVLFSILFLIILASLTALMLYTLAHTVEKDFDIKDLIFNISAYLVLWGVYILGKEYIGNDFINTFLEWLISVGAITNVIFPLIIFVISITIWKWREELEGKS